MQRKLRRTLPLLLALTIAYSLGYFSNAIVHADPPETAMAPYAQLETFARVLSYIEQSYVDEVDEEELLYGAIKGMVDQLDPHSNFLTPDELAAMHADTRGEYVGVGLELDSSGEEVIVVAPIVGGPAVEAGIEAGDVIVEVDGVSVAGTDVHDVVNQLRGEQGDEVELLIRRGDEESGYEWLTFSVIRDVIRLTAVEAELLAPGFGLISVSSFQLGVSDDLQASIDALEVENDDELEGLILDLRNNPGGLLSEAVNMSDLFLDDGIVVSTEGRDPEENVTHHSYDGTTRYDGPVVVLVNGGTASASEIVAGALQDRDRGVLIGSTTFGKGTVQSIIDFHDGSGLKLTVARYFTPNHRSIHGDGISPDTEVGAGTTRPGETIDPTEDGRTFEPIIDNQILAALDQLRAWGVSSTR